MAATWAERPDEHTAEAAAPSSVQNHDTPVQDETIPSIISLQDVSHQPQLDVNGRNVHLQEYLPPLLNVNAEALDERTLRHMRGACFGGCGWLLCWLSAYAVFVSFTLLAHFNNPVVKPVSILWTWGCTLIGGVGYTAIFYRTRGIPAGIPVGLLAESFWWGGIGGVLCAIIGEVNTSAFFAAISPDCNTGTTHIDDSPSEACQVGLLVQLIMIPGFWEELFKAIWVCIRFKKEAMWTLPVEDVCGERTRTERVPRTTCYCFPSTICTFWWRVASRPEAVFLSAMAAAAGFEAIENIEYMFPVTFNKRNSMEVNMAINLFRAVLATHVLWSGLVGIRFAQRLFAPDDKKPSLVMTLLPSMVLHGLWDFCAFYYPSLLILLVLYLVSLYMFLAPLGVVL
jgi:RsiW-degrading membrane proteinase PrsW (M82 family)